MSEGVKIIWILFGDMSGFESDINKLKNTYRTHKSVVNEHQYTLGMPDYLQTKETFIKLLQVQGTRAVVWHSHGAYSNWGPRGYLVDKREAQIKPGDLSGLKLNLEFAALFGCTIASNTSMYNAWKKAFGLDKYKGDYGSVESRFLADTSKAWFWGKRYGGNEPAAQKFAQYKFPRWIKSI